jgi:nicotinate-nucleotide adenylyltransferase
VNIALFGGTFDPVHNGHLAVAQAAADRFSLDRVLFIPSGRPPHKDREPQAPYEDRYRMAEFACQADPRFEASRLEDPQVLGGGKTYSVDTIERVRDELAPGDDLYFLIGQDAFDELAIWHRLEDVVEKVEFIVASRPHSVSSVRREGVAAQARFQELEGVDVPISATAVRRLAAQGSDLRGSVPDPVADYIRRHRLYQKNEGGRPDGRPPFCLE